MLHSLLISTLLATSAPAAGTAPAAFTTDALMDLLSPGSGALIRLGNPAERLQSDDAGAWLGVLSDPGVQRAVRGMLEELEAPDLEFGKNLLGCLAACRGGVAVFPNMGGQGMFAALEVDSEFLPRLTEMLSAMGVPTATDLEFAGRKADLIVYVDDLVIPMVTSGSHLLIGHGTPEIASATFDRYAKRIAGEGDEAIAAAAEHPWWHELDNRVPDPLIEGFFHVPDLLGDEVEGVDLADYVTTGYMGLSTCTANVCESSFYLNLGPNKALGKIVGSLRSADRNFLRLAPEGAIGGGVFAMDLVGMIGGFRSLAESVDEQLGAQFDAAVSGISSSVGIDVMEDLLPAFTGEFLTLTFLDPEIGAALIEEGDEAPTYVLGVADMEPLITLAEFGEDLLDGALVASEAGDFTIWTMDEEMLGLPLCIAISEDHFLLGPPKRVSVVRSMIAGGEGAPASALSDEELKSLPDAPWITFQDVDATWDALEGLVSMALAQSPDMAPMIDAGSALLDSLQGRMSGLTVTTFDHAPERISIRARIH